MFTGLIETTGVFEQKNLSGESGKLIVRPNKTWRDLTEGESIAVNGACLTLERESNGALTFHVMKETFDRTNLGSLRRGALVNMERALRLCDRLGGHLVSGHVDSVAEVLSFGRTNDGDVELRIAAPKELRAHLTRKGSVCINGTSLTVVRVDSDSFATRIIPTTWNETNLRLLSPGDFVNVETDVLAKYVEAVLTRGRGDEKPALSMEDLSRAGF